MRNKKTLKIWHEQINKIATYLFGTDCTKQEIAEIEKARHVLCYFLEDKICCMEKK